MFGEAVEDASEFEDGGVYVTDIPDDYERSLRRRKLEVDIQLAEAQTRRSDAEAKLLHVQAITLALQLGETQGIPSNPRYHEVVRGAVNAAMLAPGQVPGDNIDAAQYLQMRGHTKAEIGHMAGEFGKALKLARLKVFGQTASTSTQDYGADEKEVFQYSRQNDREFLAAVYDEFMRRPLFQRVVAQRPSLSRQVRAALEGTRGYGA